MRPTSFGHALALTALFSTCASALSTVSRAGRFLYSADGTRFYIKGIAYQEQGQTVADPNAPFSEPSTFIDPLANDSACTRDAPILQQAGVNTIRVYSVDHTLNHDACMKAFSAANIYTIIDLTLPVNGSIDRSSPAWSTNLLDSYIRTIDVFSKYDNVLVYNVGNEVVTSANETSAAPFIKAAARDTKAYLKSKNLPQLVGYAAIDASVDWLVPFANFLSCDSEGDAMDIFGLNNYEWCGDSTFAASYTGIESAFASYNIPAYFSEYGCITSPPRLWTEVAALLSTQMSDVWSGGVAFSYFPATSDQGQFGMVTISGNTVTPSADFTRLSAQYNNGTGPNSPSKSGAGATNFPTCPAQSANFLASTTLPPTPNDTACACVVNNLSCQFTPQTSNTSALVGELLNTACGLLGQNGGNCNDIAGSGSSGTYGRLAFCDPSSKLAFVMTQFYEATNRNAQSCSFNGNATVNTHAPSSASALNAAVSQCLVNTATTFTPTAPAAGSGGSGSGSGGGGSGSNGHGSGHNAASSLVGDFKTFAGLGAVTVVAILGGVLTVL